MHYKGLSKVLPNILQMVIYEHTYTVREQECNIDMGIFFIKLNNQYRNSSLRRSLWLAPNSETQVSRLSEFSELERLLISNLETNIYDN